MSRVMPMPECPRRSLTILGARQRAIAGLHAYGGGHESEISEDLIVGQTPRMSLRKVPGGHDSPPDRVHTRSWSQYAGPSANRSSACLRRCARNPSTVIAARAIDLRLRCVFGDLNLRPPLVCSSVSTTVIVRLVKSTLHHRKPRISPRRSPVVTANMTGM